MPSSRRLRITGLIAVLTVLIIVYITNGARNTYTSPFYTRTVEAMKNRQSAEVQENMIAEEKQRMDRVERLQKEHDIAVSAAAASETADAVVGAGKSSDEQKPLAHNVQEADEAAAPKERVKPVAGRKTMSAFADKIVSTKPSSAADYDGVAKVGNVQQPKATNLVADSGEPDAETEEDHRVETELNDILKKGPIIIFSKSYCPFSKKAKHILLDLYTINPPPYVVELDQHELGSGLQSALEKSTGRRTVPNVLINGKSIGGGDDVEALHNEGKLAEKVQALGGKRIVEVKKKETEGDKDSKVEVKFRS